MPQLPSQPPGSPDLPKRLPLVIEPENRSESADKDSRLINAYIETDKKTGEIHLYKRPGLLQYATTIAGTGLGINNWLGDVYRIQGATIYKNDVAIGGGAPNGALNTAGGIYSWSACLGATPAMQFGNGAATYNYDSSTPITTIAGANFPAPAVKGLAYLDGTTYAMNAAASIRGCTSLNSPTVWTDATNAIIAQIEPDAGVALGKQLVYVIAFKQWTTEVFYDALNATGSPLGPVQGAKINYGCASAESIQEVDGKLLWVSTNRTAGAQVSMLDNLKHSFVSSKAIDRLLESADLTSVASFSYKGSGHAFYGVTIKNSNITLVYDLTEGMWAFWTDASGNYFPMVSSSFVTTTKLLQHESNGKLYAMDPTYTSDDGSVITVDIYTPNFDANTKRSKNMPLMKFVGDQTVGSILQVRSNDRDFATDEWSNFRYVDMGTSDPRLDNNGSFRRRAYHIRHQSNTRLRLAAVELDLNLGTL